MGALIGHFLHQGTERYCFNSFKKNGCLHTPSNSRYTADSVPPAPESECCFRNGTQLDVGPIGGRVILNPCFSLFITTPQSIHRLAHRVNGLSPYWQLIARLFLAAGQFDEAYLATLGAIVQSPNRTVTFDDTPQFQSRE